MDLEERFKQYCENSCADDNCLTCQLHQFMEIRRSGQCLSTKPTAVFSSDTHSIASFSLSSGSTSISGSQSFDGQMRNMLGQFTLSPVEKKIYEAFQKTGGVNLLESVQVDKRKAMITFAPPSTYDHLDLAISSAVRVLAGFPILTEIEIKVGKVELKTTAPRVEQLVGREAFLKIGEDWTSYWTYFRATKRQAELKEKVFQYLQGSDNDSPSLIQALIS